MVLIRLRLGILMRDLEFRFKISSSTISKIFNAWMPLMNECMSTLVYLPDLVVIQQKIPNCFQNFKDTRIVLKFSSKLRRH